MNLSLESWKTIMVIHASKLKFQSFTGHSTALFPVTVTLRSLQNLQSDPACVMMARGAGVT